jgi:formylglycine-generating enzyme required for sulfatase activity
MNLVKIIIITAYLLSPLNQIHESQELIHKFIKKIKISRKYEHLNQENKLSTIHYSIMNDIKIQKFNIRNDQETEYIYKNRHIDIPPRVINYNFYVKATEVTILEWNTIMNEVEIGPCGPLCPKQNISFVDAVNFANKLSKANNLEECYVMVNYYTITWPRGTKCKGYRLPTLLEWHYYAEDMEEIINTEQIKNYTVEIDEITSVATKKPNKYNLYDLIGSGGELIWDSFSRNPDTDFKENTMGGLLKFLNIDNVIIKGNLWYHRGPHGVYLKEKYIHGTDPREETIWTSFRLVRTE